MPSNPIRNVFIARYEQLISQLEESKAIDHSSTIGTLRESYLRSFIRDMFPPKFQPTSGFIIDAYGNTTPQLDMIFIDRSELPMVSLLDNIALVPVEMALLNLEIKSRITREGLDQVKRQRDSLSALSVSYLGGGPGDFLAQMGSVIFAFDSDLNDDVLYDSVGDSTGISGICVVNQVAIFPTLPFGDDSSPKMAGLLNKHKLQVSPENASEPVLAFIGAIYRFIVILSAMRKSKNYEQFNKRIKNEALQDLAW